MSLDQSLKISGGLAKHRNVLSRAERIAKLTEDGRFDPETSEPTGLPKVISRKVATAEGDRQEVSEEGKG